VKKLLKNKIVNISLKTVIVVFAIIGFVLTTSFFAIKLHIFNDPGAVDYNDRYFQEYGKGNICESDTSENNIIRIAKFYANLEIINNYFPKNAVQLHKCFQQHKNIYLAERMLDAIKIELADSNAIINKINICNSNFNINKPIKNDGTNVFEWMNITEWNDFKVAVKKDSALIDSVSRVVRVEPRLIVSVLLGEQMRLFNSTREVYKKVISPLKILSVESKFSLGVTGIKEETAIQVERYLKDPNSPFYLGKDYENILGFKTVETTKERFDRLVNYRNHYYSYLYAAIILKQIRQQWLKSGYDISNRPEILATLYNVGFYYSKPKSNPSVGGSHITINEKDYSFGALAYEFYYSGELDEMFPYKLNYW